jgi:very-short-patch-repair endonuclease
LNTQPEQRGEQDPRPSLTAALEQLRLKLLDLTGRNRLLNFKHTPGRSLQSVDGDPQALYASLVEGSGRNSVTIRGVPEPQRADWWLRDGRLVRPDASEWAKVQGIPHSVDLQLNRTMGATFRALLYPDDLAKHCRKLERESKLAIEETGANMLFLVLGFLEYPDQALSDRRFLAPLISVPVALSSSSQGTLGGDRLFEIDYNGDDIATNLSLYEKLRVDHGLILPDFDEEPPADLNHYFKQIAEVVRNRPGFTVKRRVSLCLLSFTNMLLFRDLDPENWPSTGDSHAFLDHAVIRQLFEGQQDDGSTSLAGPTEHKLDEGPAASIPLVFDADSSQHSALIDVLHEKRHLVIEGPPGTGKSQTITNLIAASIAAGKTVLFVAEKLAALEVVKSRLSSAGLDPFVLELHSSKTSKKRVLEELEKRIAFRPAASIDLPQKLERLTRYRQRLQAYVNLLKSVTNNAMGLKVHALIWRTARYRLQLSVEDLVRKVPDVRNAASLSTLSFDQRLDTLKHLAAQYDAIGGFNQDSPFWGFFPEGLLPGDEHNLKQKFSAADSWSAALIVEAETYRGMLGKGPAGVSFHTAPQHIQTIRELCSRAPAEAPLHLLPRLFKADASGARVREFFEKVKGRLARHRELEAVVRAGLRVEADGTIERRDALRNLATIFAVVGGHWGAATDLADRARKLEAAAATLKQGLMAVQEFAGAHQLPKADSRLELEKLEAFAAEAIKLPDMHWRLFQADLMDPDATRSLEALAQHQLHWNEAYAALSDHFYLDALPTEDMLRTAVVTLREGPAWYRIFQRRWRAAAALHRSLLRTKRRVGAADRLADLERIHGYLKLRHRWQNDPAWARFCKVVPDGAPVDLEGYLGIARWYERMRAAFDGVGTDGAVGALSIEQAQKFKREFVAFSTLLKTVRQSIHSIDEVLPKLQHGAAGRSAQAAANGADWVSQAIGAQLVWLRSACQEGAEFAACLAACEAADERRFIASELGSSTSVRDLLGDQFRGIATDIGNVLRALDWGQQVQSADLPTNIKRLLLGTQGIANARRLAECLTRVTEGLSKATSLEGELQRYGSCDLSVWCQQRPEDDIVSFAQNLHERLAKAANQAQGLIEWAQYMVRRGEALSEDLGEFVALLEAGHVPPKELAAAFGYATFSTIVREIFSQAPELQRFSGLQQNEISRDFRHVDQEIISGRGRCIAADAVNRAAPSGGRGGARVDDKTEMALLNHLIPQQRPRVPVRKLLFRAGGAIQALKPCLMMGPQAVAQFLDPCGMKFDLVIMDEASQLRPEEAIGAIARGRQLVVVGDPKQLPPTTFFARQNPAGDDTDEYTTTEAESILDICLANFRPSRSLRWHYRSRHHSLIAFSNQHFYKGNLVVCPSPYGQNSRLGVRATYLAHAVYENQTNLVEAERVVDAVVEHITTRPRESLGVVTLNMKQRDLIAELLEERLSAMPEADEYRQRWLDERQGLFVKNLENVQGDERDCIVISTTFGHPPGANVVRQNFGPISRQGGWRRLNVLFTRARQSISIYTSLRPEDIVVEGATPEGTKALRNYLEYARTGRLDSPQQTEHEPDSDFEVAVIDVLRSMNYEVTPQLGVSGFRVDIAVKHPDHPGTYLAAIECDGAQYHSAQSARDRDRIRQEILESQGWRGRIWRIWSTDWFRGATQEIHKLKGFLDHLRQTWKPDYSAGASWTEEGLATAAVSEPPQDEQTQRQRVDQRLLLGESDIEVQIGDTVEYIDASRGEDVLAVRITRSTTALEQGLIAERTPLAQALLGGVVGDEVALNIPAIGKRTLRIMAIKRDER